jgi:hypothetical protein
VSLFKYLICLILVPEQNSLSELQICFQNLDVRDDEQPGEGGHASRLAGRLAHVAASVGVLDRFQVEHALAAVEGDAHARVVILGADGRTVLVPLHFGGRFALDVALESHVAADQHLLLAGQDVRELGYVHLLAHHVGAIGHHGLAPTVAVARGHPEFVLAARSKVERVETVDRANSQLE